MAVHRPGQDFSGTGFSGTSRPTKQVSVRQLPTGQGVTESTGNMLLSNHLCKTQRAAAPVKAQVGHVRTPLQVTYNITNTIGRAPAFDFYSQALTGQLTPSQPVAPATTHLPLLPPGPDGVHELAPHGTGPSSPLAGAGPKSKEPGRGFNPALADCGFRAPLLPISSTAKHLYGGEGFEPSDKVLPSHRSRRAPSRPTQPSLHVQLYLTACDYILTHKPAQQGSWFSARGRAKDLTLCPRHGHQTLPVRASAPSQHHRRNVVKSPMQHQEKRRYLPGTRFKISYPYY